ncbi:MAG: hypothetical protein EOO93_22055, partial [Pedobacter sp.]
MAISDDGKEIWANIKLNVREDKSDRSETEGTWRYKVYTAPAGKLLNEIISDKNYRREDKIKPTQMKLLKTSALLILIGLATATMAQKKANESGDDAPCPLPKYKPGQTSAEVNRETMDYVMCKRAKAQKANEKRKQ